MVVCCVFHVLNPIVLKINFFTLEEIQSDMSIGVNRSIQSAHKVYSNLFIWFKAGEEILLDAGFEISKNSIFIAEIGGCIKDH